MSDDAKKTVISYLMLRSVSAFGIAFIGATYAIFLLGKGLTLLEVNLVNFAFYGTLFIFEIPTGAFADVFGRKISFVISCFLFGGGMFLYAISTSFWGFVLAEMICAVGATFASGAFQAWLIDRLRHQNYHGSVTKIFAKEQQIRSGLSIAAALIGSFAADKNMALPWLLGGYIMLGVGILAVLLMKEEEFVHQTFSFRQGAATMGNTIKASLVYGSRNPAVRFVIIIGIAQFFAVQAPNMQWQPFFSTFFVHKRSLGFIFTAISLSLAAGSAIAPAFLRMVKDERMALAITQVLTGAGICVMLLFSKLIPTLSIFLLHEIARGMFVPLKDVYLNDNIPSKERATLLSLDSISHHIGGMIGLLGSGAIAQYASMRSAWIFSGSILILTTVIIFGRNRHKDLAI